MNKKTNSFVIIFTTISLITTIYSYGMENPYATHSLLQGIFTSNLELVSTSIDLKADVNYMDEFGNRPLHIAIIKDHSCVENGKVFYSLEIKRKNLEIIQKLINSHANVNEQTYFHGFTALHLAMQPDGTEKVKLLLKARATPSIKDYKGRTPYYYAHIHNYKDIEKLLNQDN